MSYIRSKFKRVADICGWNITKRFEDVNIPIKMVPGYIMLEKHWNKGWDVTQIANRSGGEKLLFHGQTRFELAAWLDGIEFAYQREGYHDVI